MKIFVLILAFFAIALEPIVVEANDNVIESELCIDQLEFDQLQDYQLTFDKQFTKFVDLPPPDVVFLSVVVTKEKSLVVDVGKNNHFNYTNINQYPGIKDLLRTDVLKFGRRARDGLTSKPGNLFKYKYYQA